MREILPLLILFRGFTIEAFPAFAFNSVSLKEQNHSFASLIKDIHPSYNFILCSSIKQARFDDVGFYTISGQDSQAWWAMEFQTYLMDTKLMIRQGKDIHTLEFLDPKLDFWYHI